MNDQDTITKVIAEMRELEADYTERALVREWADRLAALDGWRPIESAPKDGERILCSTPTTHTYITVAFWDDLSDRWREWDIWEYCKPTHWMPLPAPPKGTKE